MKETEVKKIIGDENWNKFLEWMSGQTVGCNNDGSIDYFKSDVKAFENKLINGVDRQAIQYGWD